MRLHVGVFSKEQAPPDAESLSRWFKEKGANIAIMGGDIDWAVAHYNLGECRSGNTLSNDGFCWRLVMVEVEGHEFLVMGKGTCMGINISKKDIIYFILQQLHEPESATVETPVGDDADTVSKMTKKSSEFAMKTVMGKLEHTITLRECSDTLHEVFTAFFSSGSELATSRMSKPAGICLKVRFPTYNYELLTVFAMVQEMLVQCQKEKRYNIHEITDISISSSSRSASCVAKFSFPVDAIHGAVDKFDINVKCQTQSCFEKQVATKYVEVQRLKLETLMSFIEAIFPPI